MATNPTETPAQTQTTRNAHEQTNTDDGERSLGFKRLPGRGVIVVDESGDTRESVGFVDNGIQLG